MAPSHLLSVESLSLSEIESIFAAADRMLLPSLHDPSLTRPLTGKVIFSAFFENSTRTRLSFELAAQRLGASLVSMTEQGSSMAKGETMEDSLSTLAAMRPDMMIVRLKQPGLLQPLADRVAFPIISAGEGSRHHPTQALLDAYTICRFKGGNGAKYDIAGKIIALCGDIARSRVAHSNILLLERLGARIHLVAPETMQPVEEYAACTRFTTLEEGIHQADVVMMLRTQKERSLSTAGGKSIPGEDSQKEGPRLPASFCLDHVRLRAARPDVIVMHPGPLNRGEEITSALADDPQYSQILTQVSYGVAIRMAVLSLFG